MKKSIEKTLKKPFLVWAMLWLITMAFYYSTLDAGFTMDFTGWQERYENGSFADILNCFGYPGNHQLLHLVFYSWYKIFFVSGWPWFLLFTSLHALNGSILFFLLQKALRHFKVDSEVLLSGAATLMFLLSPYQAEVLVWKVCVHYLLSAACLLGVLWFVVQYCEKEDWTSLILSHLIFVASLFLLEVSFMTPIIISLFILFWTFEKDNFNKLIERLLRLSLPQFSLLGLYLILNRITLGAWVGHYGAEQHLTFPVKDMIATGLKYLAKHGAFVRYFSHKTKESIFTFMDKDWVVTTFVVLSVIVIIFLIKYFKRLSGNLKLALLSLGVFFVSIVPVSNLYFYYFLYNENDRYGYIASLFLMIAVILCFNFFKPLIRNVLILTWIGLSIFYLNNTTNAWSHNQTVFQGLLEGYEWTNEENVVVLNIPDNFKGTFLYRTFGDSTVLSEHLRYRLKTPPKGNIWNVAQYNMMGPEEGVSVEKINAKQLNVIFNQWGNWWWKGGIGANNYENDLYKFEKINKGYTIYLKEIPKGTIFLYQVGNKWKEFELKD